MPVNFPQMGEALKRHVIDVAWLPEPFGSADAESMGLRNSAISIRARRRTSRSDGTS